MREFWAFLFLSFTELVAFLASLENIFNFGDKIIKSTLGLSRINKQSNF